jgi:hypothetical protein
MLQALELPAQTFRLAFSQDRSMFSVPGRLLCQPLQLLGALGVVLELGEVFPQPANEPNEQGDERESTQSSHLDQDVEPPLCKM